MPSERRLVLDANILMRAVCSGAVFARSSKPMPSTLCRVVSRDDPSRPEGRRSGRIGTREAAPVPWERTMWPRSQGPHHPAGHRS